MPKILPNKQSVAVLKHAPDVLRSIGYDSTRGYDPTGKTRSALKADQRELIRAAQIGLAAMERCKDDNEERSLEEAHEGLMALYDVIEDDVDERRSAPAETSAETRARRRPMSDTAEFRCDDLGSMAEISDKEPSETFALRSSQTYSDFIEKRSPNGEFRTLSTGAYLRAMVVGPKSDIEKRALSEGTDSAGGFTVPDVLSARLIDRLRAASVLFRAGAQTVPLLTDTSYIAKLVNEPVPAWRAENASIVESDPTFGRVTFQARSLAVIVRLSRELLEDSLNIETALPNVLAIALAQEVDRAGLLGTGTAPEPRGVSNFAGLTTSGFAGGDLENYLPLIRARTALRTANSDVTAYIMSPRDEGRLAGLLDGNGQPVNVPPAIAKVPMLTTSKIPVDLGTADDESVILAGDWARLMIGIRSTIRIEILRERYADVHQYAFVAHLRADFAAEHEAAFTKLSGVTIP